MPTDIVQSLQEEKAARLFTPLNPPRPLPAIELVLGESTAKESMDTVRVPHENLHKVPVTRNHEMTGCVANHIQIRRARDEVM
ncbi:3-hydroxyacyl-CoA dehydrogenase NAD-binding domain-containing protein [Corynebacterium hadale]|uniref:3-hydroxyacyl-CoA dehydrogenase NAD-binding domain-containing protein n=1 Tax=Corynebacterium hadale TaxID=2026255 RepID=UPI00345C3952